MLTIETDKREYDGEKITIYRPVLDGTNQPCFGGKITFACYEVWTSDSEELHEQAKINAITSAKQTIENIYKEVLQWQE